MNDDYNYIENVQYWLDNMDIKKYTINDNLTVDVDGDVDISEKRLTEIPIQFGKVNGNFYCDSNYLTTLEGCPDYVKGDFWCAFNPLRSILFLPKYIGNKCYCSKEFHNSIEYKRYEVTKKVKELS